MIIYRKNHNKKDNLRKWHKKYVIWPRPIKYQNEQCDWITDWVCFTTIEAKRTLYRLQSWEWEYRYLRPTDNN